MERTSFSLVFLSCLQATVSISYRGQTSSFVHLSFLDSICFLTSAPKSLQWLLLPLVRSECSTLFTSAFHFSICFCSWEKTDTTDIPQKVKVIIWCQEQKLVEPRLMKRWHHVRKSVRTVAVTNDFLTEGLLAILDTKQVMIFESSKPFWDFEL